MILFDGLYDPFTRNFIIIKFTCINILSFLFAFNDFPNIYFEHIKGYANIITANIHLIDQIIVHNMCFIIRYFEVLL